jgi:hypothetical protein
MYELNNSVTLVPWATDNQWKALKAEADRVSLEAQRQNSAFGPPDKTDNNQKASKQDAPAAGSVTPSSTFSEPLKPQKNVRLDVNPYEGILGPGIGEGTVTSNIYKRADVSKLIKTEKSVWKAGKQPTQTFAGKLPGSACFLVTHQ